MAGDPRSRREKARSRRDGAAGAAAGRAVAGQKLRNNTRRGWAGRRSHQLRRR